MKITFKYEQVHARLEKNFAIVLKGNTAIVWRRQVSIVQLV
jgi:hypothetical protein